MSTRTLRISLAPILALVGCGGSDAEPADVAGSYTVAVTNRDNDCMLESWTEGDTAMNIPLEITQDGSDMNAEIGGLAGSWYDLVIGKRTFDGMVDGHRIEMMLHGTRSYTDGDCAATVTVEGAARLSGDALEGDLYYYFDTNGDPACGYRDECQNRQAFNGTRPPTD